jgi:hypothetical protein
MPFIAPRLVVEEQVADGSDVVTSLFGSPAPYKDFLAPAGLYDVATERVEAFQLHRLLRWDGNLLVFRTYSTSLPALSLNGREFVFRSWWTSEAWHLVTNKNLSWVRKKYPANGSHAHCAITFEAIGEREQHPEGYVSGNAWITVEAYERFVCDDAYHCRDGG